MRKVLLAAVQADMSAAAPGCNCLADDYVADADYILDHQVRPFAETSLRLVEQACEKGCDIVTTGEDICGLYRYIIDTSPRNAFPALVDASAPMVEERLSALAKKHRAYIVGCYFKRRGNAIYNTASLFDRKGELAGAYEKTHLPPDEIWQVSAGNVLNTFDVDFGRIGVEICYDIMFPEVTEILAMQGAEVIFHPTAGFGWYDSIGEATLRARANDASVHIVTAKNYIYNAAGNSCVIDHWGHIMVSAGFRRNEIVLQHIDLDEPKTQPDWFYQTHMSADANVKRRKYGERRPDLYGALGEPPEQKRFHPTYAEQRELYERVKTGECRWRS
jgi:predicted amidohydrolase